VVAPKALTTSCPEQAVLDAQELGADVIVMLYRRLTSANPRRRRPGAGLAASHGW
jgi:hypothetical protein